MFDMKLSQFLDESRKVAAAAHRATVLSLRKTAYAIFRDVQASIVTVPVSLSGLPRNKMQRLFALRARRKEAEASPNQPPHTRHGRIRAAERYDVDPASETAVIGPRRSVAGILMHVEEFGGEFKGARYPARPSIGPALDRQKGLLLAELDSRIGS